MGRSGAQYGQLGAPDVWTALATFNAGAIIKGLILAQTSKNANYTIQAADGVIRVDASAGAITITVNTALAAGRTWVVKKIDATANAVTITPSAGTIDGAASFALTAANQSAVVMIDGANAWILATH